MIKYLMKKYALSRQGAKDLVIATVSCVVHNLTLMLPVSLLYLLVSDLYAGGVPQNHLWLYIAGMAAAVLFILFSYRWVYGATYYATYKESSVRRISLAEKLRKLPLSFFGKRQQPHHKQDLLFSGDVLQQQERCHGDQEKAFDLQGRKDDVLQDDQEEREAGPLSQAKRPDFRLPFFHRGNERHVLLRECPHHERGHQHQQQAFDLRFGKLRQDALDGKERHRGNKKAVENETSPSFRQKDAGRDRRPPRTCGFQLSRNCGISFPARDADFKVRSRPYHHRAEGRDRETVNCKKRIGAFYRKSFIGFLFSRSLFVCEGKGWRIAHCVLVS